jgi:glycolate oxidase iron-sulfur subunit
MVSQASDHRVAGFLDPEKSLACIHCGLCLSSCPTYLQTGNENESPRGRIHLMRALQDGRLPLGPTVVESIDHCLGCRACESACPSGVQYGNLLEHTRNYIESRHRRPLLQTLLRRVAIERVFPHSLRLRVAMQPVMWLRKLGLDRLFSGWLRDSMDLVPDRMDLFVPDSRKSRMADERSRGRRGRVALVTGCVMPVLFGSTHRNTIRLLENCGWEVCIPRDQACCGALHAHLGKLDAARDFARRNIETFESTKADYVVVNAAGCGSTLKEYHELLGADPAWESRARLFSGKVRDLTEMLEPASFSASESRLTEWVTYHDACHLGHAQRITKQPRELIKAVAGDRYVELPESDLCCGSAGTYNLTEPAMAAQLGRRKVANILKTRATTVVTTNPGCLLQLRTELKRAGAHNVRAMHLADFLVACPVLG